MSLSDAHHDPEAGPSSWREAPVRRTSDNVPTTPVPSALTTNESFSVSDDLLRLARALAYVVSLILVHLRDTSSAVVRSIHRALPPSRHPNDALLPQYTSSVTSGADPPSISSEHFRDAVFSSFISTSSSAVPEAATERTPLLDPHTLHETSTKSRQLPHLQLNGNSVPALAVCGYPSTSMSEHATNTTLPSDNISPELDTPSASTSSSSSSPSSSAPSSSNSSFTMLRPALKTPSPAISAPTSPRFGLLRLGFGPETIDGLATGRSSPASKSVRFNPEGNETHFFEYAPHEEHETKSLKSPSNSLGKWKKNGGTIVWQVRLHSFSFYEYLDRFDSILITTYFSLSRWTMSRMADRPITQ